MTEYAWTDEVPEDCSYLTPNKRYLLKRDAHLSDVGEITDDDGELIDIIISESAHLCGRAWNIETDDTPGQRLIAAATEARDLLAARVTVAGRSMTVAELIAAHERDQWQPIETAPRDETILIWPVSYGRPAPARWWDSTERGGYWDVAHMNVATCKRLAPTHWRPLPAPPAPTETEGA